GAVPPPAPHLYLGGSTGGFCANRIERKLAKIDGVAATVNFATERAHVRYPAGVDPVDLVSAVESAGYTATVSRAAETAEPSRPEADAAPDGLGRRLVVSAVAAVPVVALSMIPALQFDYWQWFALALTTLVVFWGGYPFHRAALINARHGSSTMDTLVSLGTLAAYWWSLWALVFGTAGHIGMTHEFTLRLGAHDPSGQIYLEVSAAVTVFLLAGRYAESRAKRRAGAALRALIEVGAKDVAVLRGEGERRIPVGQLSVGDRFVVRPGEKVATDGRVLEGAAAVDASMITGESVPIEVAAGDAVVGGTVNTNGQLVVLAERVGADTQLAHIAKLVTDAQNGKAAVARLADRVSSVFVPVVLVIAALTLAGWLLAGQAATEAFTAAVAVLIVACPCALGLATPTALLVGTGRGAQLGILIKGPEVLEQTKRIDTVVLDKTGTVTTGRMALDEVVPARGEDPVRVLALAAAVERASEHPVARAIAAAGGAGLSVTEFENRPGVGVVGLVDGVRVSVGRPDGPIPAELQSVFATGRTAVAVAWDGVVRGAITVADAVKPTSAEAVAQIVALGMTPVLLTGDRAEVGRAVGQSVGISRVIAEVLPEDKVAHVAKLQRDGAVVAMVGDGVNDAAALATADVGLAMGTGTDAAIEAGDLTLVRGDLRSVPQAIRLSRATLGTIRANLFWAFAYNVAALPLAAFGLLNPMIAGAAMALSSVFVVGNSLRLRRFR
ncbi:heavy metal translocating P-type ATPase, partial [Rhodococcus sp. NPDC058514]|uniref:heavy metal translocating P-type ATPase n=1 Tax=Rhodococcus sp. NPDC058514 TaxID=3346532 RepID=UPI003666CC89